ncbi:Ribulokinase [Dirofilaria immitis]
MLIINQLILYFLISIICIIIQTICAERLLSITPCAYPLLSDTIHCGIDDVNLKKSVQVCDPDKAISMSEIEVIKNKLDTIYNRKNKSCICRFDQVKPCWFRFGFAFLRRMYPVESGVSNLYSREFCPANKTLLNYKKNYALMDATREFIINYGKNFARLLRERWLIGDCDEDILFFILLKRPNQLMRRNTLSYFTSRTIQPTPYIFASYGSLVQERIDAFHSFSSIDSFAINQHYLDPLEQIVETENANFENGYSLKVVTENLLDRFDAILSQADEIYSLPRSRNHIPDWAMIVFVMCALLCLLMTIGLCLMQTSVRRGSPRGKPMDTTRRWKAGFVGENMEGVPTGGVNLMQMMIQPSLRHSSNLANNYA